MGRMVNSMNRGYLIVVVVLIGPLLLLSGCGNPLIEAIQEDVKEDEVGADDVLLEEGAYVQLFLFEILILFFYGVDDVGVVWF